MKFTHFHIKNFKGIDDIRLDLTTRPQSRVQTLVGLNESGKTTILEALNFLSYKPETLDPLDLPGYSIKDVHDLIPINKRANFNESIVIEAGYSFSGEDEVRIAEFLWKTFSMRLMRTIKTLVIRQSYRFQNSKHVTSPTRGTWVFTMIVRPKGGRTDKRLSGDAWHKTVKFIQDKMLPSILFFPNFLFEFPDKIYLEEGETDKERHQFYRTTMQDVLDSIGGGVDLRTHVLDRAKEGSLNARRALESVLLKMGSHITRTVFQNWDRIFKRKAGSKEIQVAVGQDEGGYYLQLRVRDSNEIYSISERSLGFRWFFAFLLLTQYRGFRQNATTEVLFLLDEPASNLHPSAQSQLLESFANLPGDSSVIYTTHSHHMINPSWLEGTYVVKNEGLDYYSDEDDYTAKNTHITLTKYREFATKHPNQTTYFQPILDVLDFKPGRLDNVPNVVMAEGKNDFYTLKYFVDKIFKSAKRLNVMPGTGSGSLETVIRLYLGWGRRFVILLDSDREGLKQKSRYLELFGVIAEQSIFTLSDVNPTWVGKEMEDLISNDDRELIQKSVYPTALKYQKTHFNRAVQELYLTDRAITVSDETKTNFDMIFMFCAEKLGI